MANEEQELPEGIVDSITWDELTDGKWPLSWWHAPYHLGRAAGNQAEAVLIVEPPAPYTTTSPATDRPAEPERPERVMLRCADCGLPWAHIQNGSLVVKSRHRGRVHVNTIGIVDLLAAVCAPEDRDEMLRLVYRIRERREG